MDPKEPDAGATTGEEVEDTAVSMEDALGSALDSLDTTDDGKPPAETDASNADPDETTGDEETAEAKAARERDEKGRFKPKVEGEEDPGKKVEGADKTKEGEQPKVEQPQLVDGRDVTKAPSTWKPEAQAEFAKLPEAVRKEVHKREEDFHRGIEQYRGAAQFGADLAKQFQPYQKMLEATKIAPSQLVHAALQFEYTIRTGTPEQKIQILHDLAKAYGVNLSGEEEEDGDPPDPRFVSLLEEVNGLKTKLTEREQQEKKEREDAEKAERERIRSDISTFAADPKNEFYGLVRDDMLKLIQSGQGADLRDAYDKAIWLNPEVRAKLLARQQETERKETEKAERAAKAKKAANLNVAPRATPPGKATGKGTMEESLGAALDEALAAS